MYAELVHIGSYLGRYACSLLKSRDQIDESEISLKRQRADSNDNLFWANLSQSAFYIYACCSRILKLSTNFKVKRMASVGIWTVPWFVAVLRFSIIRNKLFHPSSKYTEPLFDQNLGY